MKTKRDQTEEKSSPTKAIEADAEHLTSLLTDLNKESAATVKDVVAMVGKICSDTTVERGIQDDLGLLLTKIGAAKRAMDTYKDGLGTQLSMLKEKLGVAERTHRRTSANHLIIALSIIAVAALGLAGYLGLIRDRDLPPAQRDVVKVGMRSLDEAVSEKDRQLKELKIDRDKVSNELAQSKKELDTIKGHITIGTDKAAEVDSRVSSLKSKVTELEAKRDSLLREVVSRPLVAVVDSGSRDDVTKQIRKAVIIGPKSVFVALSSIEDGEIDRQAKDFKAEIVKLGKRLSLNFVRLKERMPAVVAVHWHALRPKGAPQIWNDKAEEELLAPVQELLTGNKTRIVVYSHAADTNNFDLWVSKFPKDIQRRIIPVKIEGSQSQGEFKDLVEAISNALNQQE